MAIPASIPKKLFNNPVHPTHNHIEHQTQQNASKGNFVGYPLFYGVKYSGC